MKRIIFSLLLVSNLLTYGQENLPKNEIKLNALNLVLVEALDVTYERILSQNSSVGMDVYYFLGEDYRDSFNESKYEFTGYYRNYFTSRYNRGFFIELFAMYSKQVIEYDYYNSSSSFSTEDQNLNQLYPGVSIGGKWLTNSGFIGELLIGVGRNILNSEVEIDEFTYDYDNGDDLAIRIGISIGKRF